MSSVYNTNQLSPSERRVHLLSLGITPYAEAHQLQQTLVEQRIADAVEDTLILIEHPPTITLGRRADESHILASPERLAETGIVVHRVERGGDVTYHGPGQLLAYPILALASYHLGPSDYMHALEMVVRATCADYGLETHLRDHVIGVWVDDNKICALGVRIRRGVSYHGLALNVATRPDHWATIVPCGITDGGVTSLAQELGLAPPMQEVRDRLAQHFCETFRVVLAGDQDLPSAGQRATIDTLPG